MHPTVVSDKPGDCSICGMRLVPMEESGKRKAESQEQKREVSDKVTGDTAAVPGLAAISLTPAARQRMGLTLGTVQTRELTRRLRTSARIVADETRLFRVTTKVEGWVDKLLVAVNGQALHKGDPLLTIYSPKLLSAQQEYLSALQAAETLAAGAGGDAAAGARALIDAARQRLQLWDVSDEQISRLEKTRLAEKTLTFYAPAGGFAMEKNVLAGQKIMPGDSLMVVADLSVVWGEADIFESDLPYVKVGMPMEITLPYWPDKTFSGRVSFLSPALEPQSRTLKIRLEIPNPELLLKLEMYADASLSFALGKKLAAPEGAIMRTGERSYAFRESDDGKLIPVEVQVGVRIDGYYEIRSGLKEGDRVATSANFLLDSESSMRAAIEALAE